MIRFYKTNIVEYLKDGYFMNNTMICSENYPPFYIESADLSGSVYIYKVDELKLRAKEYSTTLFKTDSLSVSGGKVYFEETAGDSVGLYMYKLELTESSYWSDLFQIIESPTRVSFSTMDSSFLKFYDADTLEFQKDGYFDNNTYLKYATLYLGQFYFDSELTISSVSGEVYEVKQNYLQTKLISEHKIKNVTCTYSGSKVYLQQEEQLNKGLYRAKVTVTPTVGDAETFYSELFFIMTTDSVFWILHDGYWDDLGIWLDYETWNDA